MSDGRLASLAMGFYLRAGDDLVNGHVDRSEQVIVMDGCYLTAERAIKVTALSGAMVSAREGSLVTAEEGSMVTAYSGSTVMAKPGSRIVALKGSLILIYRGADITAQEGAKLAPVREPGSFGAIANDGTCNRRIEPTE